MSLPRIAEVAKLWRDPEIRYTPGGKAVASLGLVFSKRKKTEAGGWEDAGSLFVRGTLWEGYAENAVNSLSKGDNVFVVGELEMREYEKDGEKRQSLELRVYEIGPSLRWSEAKIQRIQRRSDDTSGGSDDPWSNPAQAVADEEAPF